MKRRFFRISLLFITVLITSFNACAAQDEHLMNNAEPTETIISENGMAETSMVSLSAFVASGLSDSTGTDAEEEIEGFKAAQVEDTSAPREVTVTFNGKTYTGSYARTEGRSLTYKLRHYYRCEDGSLLYIDAETGRLVAFMLGNEYDVLRLSEAECKVLANEIASQLVDVSQYTVTEQAIEAGNYLYKYIKYVGEIETSDRFNIIIDPYKGLSLFSATDIGAFSEEVLSSAAAELEQRSVILASSAAEEIVEQKIATLCKGSQYSYQIDNKILVRLQDGTVGMIYNTVCEKDGSPMGRIHILVQENE